MTLYEKLREASRQGFEEGFQEGNYIAMHRCVRSLVTRNLVKNKKEACDLLGYEYDEYEKAKEFVSQNPELIRKILDSQKA
ncbi:MAG: hypothetical protein IKS54_00215 [Erysipelotrichaceae bacterium]|nr:hypothetical protein [Erysipelotrichaceae bacterium]